MSAATAKCPAPKSGPLRSIRVALIVGLLLAGCASPGGDPPRPFYAALGDSITRGTNLDVEHRGESPGDSWATGDVPDDGVESHYERLVKLDPAWAGRAANDARSGARMRELAEQATLAVSQHATYVTILLGMNDACGRNMTSVEDFRAQFRAGVDVLDGLANGSTVYVLSLPDAGALLAMAGNDTRVRQVWDGLRVCPPLLSSRVTDEQRAAVLARLDAFNAVLREESARAGFAFDAGAVHGALASPEDIGTLDYFHPSLRGQARLAEVSWSAGPFAHAAAR